MPMTAAQPGLFDDDRGTDQAQAAGAQAADAQAADAQAAAARARMRAMIERLQAATAPPWDGPMGAILDDGIFQRAMRLVPADEAQRLWAEFDPEMERLYNLWVAANPQPAD